ncbi:sigma factor-like helix-turn-helix DNA-binding protein [Thiothrix unzii]|uniref:HTH HARE-type domain-containing protein n=1 Tax=Thiothrix unzii TaxID=111769 RepID=A0A975F6N5_9GAMM|nr:sigma factor-like helix-turn-helix DNA-binding protein [Thiothrix unzii]QTR51946.1 hypothetical protein J9260_09250 [Thiothrix unzii]
MTENKCNIEQVLEIPVTHINLPSRIKNKLESYNIKTIKDAKKFLENTPFIDGINKNSISESLTILSDFIENNKNLSPSEIDNIGDNRILVASTRDQDLSDSIDRIAYQVIKRIFHKDEERNINILDRRFSLKGYKKYTLEEIGTYNDVTRERVRQIEAKTLKTIYNILTTDSSKKVKVDITIREKFIRLESELESNGNIISEDSIIFLLKNNYQYQCQDNNKVVLLLEILGYEKLSNSFSITSLQLDSLYYSKNKISAKDIIKATSHIASLIKTPDKYSLFDIVVSNKKRKIKNISKNDIINLLSSSSCVECIDSDKEIFQTKIHCLSSAADKAYRILVNLGKPTHYRQIVKIINKQEATSSHDASLTRNITNQMVTDKRFTPIGKSGEWGLSEWNSVPNISSKDLMIKALHKKGEPMKAKEIHNEITKIRENIPLSSVNTYLVSHKDIFIRVDRETVN